MTLERIFSERVRHSEQGPLLLEAIILETATGLGVDVGVVIPTFDLNYRVGPCPWMPRVNADGYLIPAKGDEALIALDEDGKAWIASWSGTGVSVPFSGGGGTSPDASNTVKGISKLSAVPVLAANPIAVGDNDSRNSNARTPTAHTHPQGDVTELTASLTAKQDVASAVLRSRLTKNLADDTTLDDATDNTAVVNNLIATLSASASASQPKTLRFGEGILRTTGMKPAKNVILDARGCHIKKIGQNGTPQQNSLLRALEAQVGGSYYGTYSGIKLLGGTWDVNGYSCPAGIFRLLFTEGLSIDGPTILANPRVVTGVGTMDASAAITGPANTFSSADVNRPLSGAGIPGGAKIASVTSGTSATMSVNATATGTITLTMGTSWQGAFGGRNGRVEHVTTRGATMVFEDGLHHCHGPDWTYAHNDVESGDDALAVGLGGAADTYVAAEVANGTYDVMKNIVFLDNHVKAWRGHAFRAWTNPPDVNPIYRMTDIEVLNTTGQAGILRNGGFFVESHLGSDGAPMVQRVNIEGAPLEVGSVDHDDVNGYGAYILGASDVTVDPSAIRVTEKSKTVAGVVTTAGFTAITAPVGSFSPSSDVGRSIWGTNIPVGTTLAVVTSDTEATLSGNASASGTATATVGAVTGFDLVKVTSSPDCKIRGLKPGALQIKRFAVDVLTSDRFKLDDWKLALGPFVPNSPIRLKDCPDFDIGRGELLELRNGVAGITMIAGTANNNSGSIHNTRVKHAAGSSIGYAVAPIASSLTKLSLRDNDFSGSAQGGVDPVLPSTIPSFEATGNRGLADYPSRDATYKHVARGRHLIGSAAPAATYLFGESEGGIIGASLPYRAILYLDSADHAIAGRTTKVRVAGRVLTNAVAPGITFTFGLYPVTGWGGASGANPTVTSVGAAVASVALSPGASAQVEAESVDVNFPTTGWFALGCVTSGVNATNAIAALLVQLELRHV